MMVHFFGEQRDLTYPYSVIGSGPETLQQRVDGSHLFAETLRAAKNPMIIVGMGAFQRADGLVVQAAARLVGEAYGMFLVHYPVVLWLQYWLFDVGLPAIAKAAIVFVLAVISSWAATAALRRIPGATRVL